MFDILVSPLNRKKFVCLKNKLLVESTNEEYKIIKKVPILIPTEYAAKWHRELIEAVLWEYPEEIEKMYSEIDWKKSPVPIYIQYIKKLLHDKNGIVAALEKYSETNTDKWIAKNDGSKISFAQKRKFAYYAKKSNGKLRTVSKIKGEGIYEIYPYFAKAVNRNNPKTIVELGTGAGGGTAAAALYMTDSCRLFTVDISFECLGNAVGIAKYQKKKIIPVCANFWYLPFADKSVDAVCTYNGLDESRENVRTVSEVSRILKTRGTFTVVSRRNAFMRQAAVLEPFGFAREETVEMMKKCRLYGDIEGLTEQCKKYGLEMKNQKEFKKSEDVAFVLSEFVKR